MADAECIEQGLRHARLTLSELRESFVLQFPCLEKTVAVKRGSRKDQMGEYGTSCS